MIKRDIINEVVNKTGITKTKAEMAVDAVFESMMRALAHREHVMLRRFGVFDVRPRKTELAKALDRSHLGVFWRDPFTVAQVEFPHGKAVRFKLGKAARFNARVYQEMFSPRQQLFLDEGSGKIGYGLCYGEQSYNGRPIYSGNLKRSSWEIPSRSDAVADEIQGLHFSRFGQQYEHAPRRVN